MPIGSTPSDTTTLGTSLEVLEELLEPELEVEPVPEDQLGILRPQDVAGRRLVIVDLGAGLGDRFDDRRRRRRRSAPCRR